MATRQKIASTRALKETPTQTFFRPGRVLLFTFLTLILVLLLMPTDQAFGDDAGWALRFDGNNDLVRLHETELMLGPGWQTTKTVSLWVKPTGASPCSFNVAACDNIFGDRPRWWGISIGEFDGEDKIWFYNYCTETGIDHIGVDYTPDTWVHLAYVHDNDVLYAYKNGVQVGSVPTGATCQPDTGAYPVLHLGGIIVSSERNWTFAGDLDEVRIWNLVRTQQQIQDNMYQSLVGDETGLRAYYKMSDGSGLTLTDDSIYDWDGTLLDGTGPVPPDGHYPEWVTSDAFVEPPPPTSTPTPTPGPTPDAWIYLPYISADNDAP